MIPPEITNLLGKSPHEYFQAGMELVNHNNTKGPRANPVANQPAVPVKTLEF